MKRVSRFFFNSYIVIIIYIFFFISFDFYREIIKDIKMHLWWFSIGEITSLNWTIYVNTFSTQNLKLPRSSKHRERLRYSKLASAKQKFRVLRKFSQFARLKAALRREPKTENRNPKGNRRRNEEEGGGVKSKISIPMDRKRFPGGKSRREGQKVAKIRAVVGSGS